MSMSGSDSAMTRRQFLNTSAAAVAAGLSGQALGAGRHDEPARQPNIVLLVGEQHNPRVLGCAGHPVVRTPNLDRLAIEGVYCPNAYSATPLCVPGRVSMFTSRFGHATGVVKNLYEDMLGDMPTLARSLRDAGYHTCHIGKTHLACNSATYTPEGRKRFAEVGFDEDVATAGKIGGSGRDAYGQYLKDKGLWDTLKADYARRNANRDAWLGESRPSVLDVEDYFDEWISRQAETWLGHVSTDTPFYLSVNWVGPHAFRDAPGKYAKMYDPTEIDPAIDDPMTDAPEPIRERQQKTLARLRPDDWRNIRASYYGMISLIDDGIGRLLEVLRRRGLLDNTLIIYTADHGEMLCDHGMVYKTLMYEQSAAIPFIARWPGHYAQGRVSTSCISQVDLAPTLLEAGRAKPIRQAHGRSLGSILAGRGESDDPVFCEFLSTLMIRDGRYKYVCDRTWQTDQLFDLQADPSEVNSLSASNPKLAAALRERINAWLDRTEGAALRV